ncbi:hypothetical protein AMAG_08195 [Allomyces macrogynus ATCC 38327]|uniref:GPI-anchor transamidase n=1 Tax=Allomyces macrogynus (strain ATCC 38327) TaxID=578462 RepID=A0A0L0SKR4_ALLM3|nr:hypothetical protein AMAG_08195 [Allomyces macrogynus ATCC 38327]|eukprot:KNE63028.1 hypothetical protein AMAG_08195 [Allomyces macrogynus ATCC 38327]
MLVSVDNHLLGHTRTNAARPSRPPPSHRRREHGPTTTMTRTIATILAVLAVTLVLALPSFASPPAANATAADDATNNWAVLVCTSRYWFNYRHVANTLSMYRTVKRLGIPDDQILLLLADDMACNPRNSRPASVINNAEDRLDLYGDTVEVDYRGYEVTVENFMRLLTDRMPEHTPRSKRLLTDEKSRILVFMTGHGGDEFLKFQDKEELGAQDLADAFAQMWEKRRYREVLFMVDTCQANTLYSRISAPNVVAVGSSAKDESSYSHHMDMNLGVSVIDRFTYANLEALESVHLASASASSPGGLNRTSSLADLFATYDPVKLASTPGVRSDLSKRPLESIPILDFFGASLTGAKVPRDEDRVVLEARLEVSPVPTVEKVARPTEEEVGESKAPRPVGPVKVGPASSWRAYLHAAALAGLVGIMSFVTLV